MSEKKTIIIEQYASGIRRPKDQKQTLVGLGLNKVGRRREVTDNDCVRGKIRKVSHMVRIVDPA